MEPRIRFNLPELHALVAVAERGSFRAAAEALHVSQPALSRRIDKLEGALGARLFERTTRRVSLTAVGREFARRAAALLEELDSSLLTMQEVAATRAGEVTVACVPSAVYYYLPDFIRRFHERFPRVRVRIVDEAANTVLQNVVRGEADFGINFLGAQEPEVEFHPLLRERFVAACRRDHALARRRRVTWKELAEHDFMALSKASGNRVVMDIALAGKAAPRWFYEVRHVAGLLGLVEAGLGVAAVPQLAMPGPGHPTLVGIPLAEPVVTRTLGLIRRRGRPLPAAAQSLYDLISREPGGKPSRSASGRPRAGL